MGTRQRTRKAQVAKAERTKGLMMIGVLEIDDRMRQLDRCYARLQFTGSRAGKVVKVVALTSEANSWR